MLQIDYQAQPSRQRTLAQLEQRPVQPAATSGPSGVRRVDVLRTSLRLARELAEAARCREIRMGFDLDCRPRRRDRRARGCA